jgi:hypothetical protein
VHGLLDEVELALLFKTNQKLTGSTDCYRLFFKRIFKIHLKLVEFAEKIFGPKHEKGINHL